jgi:hypothetical protein
MTTSDGFQGVLLPLLGGEPKAARPTKLTIPHLTSDNSVTSLKIGDRTTQTTSTISLTIASGWPCPWMMESKSLIF